jgi:iron complex transport system ATP-binding protein
MLEVKNLSVSYGQHEVVSDLSFSVNEGEWLMLIGPNGAGKSTIISAVSQSEKYTGNVSFEGLDVKCMKPSELAKLLGVLSQNHIISYSFTVGEIVRLGRYAYSPRIFSKKSDEDEISVERALEVTGMTELEGHYADTLSGGELQRAFLAQLFAQNPRLLILDEPTNHLDLVYQKQIFEIVSQWLKTPGRAVMSVVHDLSLARRYGSRAILLNKGKAVASGSVAEVFSRENLNSVYSMDVYDWMKTQLSQWEDE